MQFSDYSFIDWFDKKEHWFVKNYFSNDPVMIWFLSEFDMSEEKKLPAEKPNEEIKVKKSQKAEAMKKAPDEVIAMAIRDMLLKEKEKK